MKSGTLFLADNRLPGKEFPISFYKKETLFGKLYIVSV